MSWIWGIDVAVGHLAVAFADLETDNIDVVSIDMTTDSKEGERLAAIDEHVSRFARVWAVSHPPHIAWVEQPSGPYDNLSLKYAAGVVQAALYRELGGAPVWTITSGMWKRVALGYGNASKAQVAAWVADTLGVDTASQDEADAVCIAVAGRDRWLNQQWEKAA